MASSNSRFRFYFKRDAKLVYISALFLELWVMVTANLLSYGTLQNDVSNIGHIRFIPPF